MQTNPAVDILVSPGQRINCALFTPDGKSIVSTGADGWVKLFPVSPPGPAQFTFDARIPISWLAASRDAGLYLLTTYRDPPAPGDFRPRLLDGNLRDLGELDGHDRGITWGVLSPDASLAATSSLDGTALVWDLNTRRRVCVVDSHVGVPSHGIVGGVWSVTFSPGSRLLATGGSDDTVRISGISSRTAQTQQVLRGHEGVVFSLDFSGSGLLATAGEDSQVVLWDTNTWQPISRLQGHQGWVVCVRFSEDGNRLATASWDGRAKLWEVRTGSELMSIDHPGGLHSVDLSRDGTRIATACDDGHVRIWTLQ